MQFRPLGIQEQVSFDGIPMRVRGTPSSDND